VKRNYSRQNSNFLKQKVIRAKAIPGLARINDLSINGNPQINYNKKLLAEFPGTRYMVVNKNIAIFMAVNKNLEFKTVLDAFQ